MRRDELTAIGELTGDALAGIAGQVHGIHNGIARIVWSSAGPLSAPVRITHDLIAAGTYAGVQRSLSTAARAGARALSTAVPDDAPSLERSAAGRVALGVLNGAVGGTLERRRNALAVGTTLRSAGQDLEPTEAALRAAFPDAGGRLAVFVHGLGETDDAWSRGRDPYGARLRRELGYTPVFVRYNSGRAVSSTGRELDGLLRRVSAAWPVSIGEIVLIGHAMGGLVARSACQQGAGAAWRTRVRCVLTLGPPDRGVAVPFAGDVEHYFVDYRRFGTLRQLRLLNDPAVYEQIRARLSVQRGLPASAGQRP